MHRVTKDRPLHNLANLDRKYTAVLEAKERIRQISATSHKKVHKDGRYKGLNEKGKQK